jgi:two-component system chemotaxis response regulator CheY
MSGVHGAGSAGRILIVDDASLIRMFYGEALRGAGYEVDEALNGLEALEKLLVAPAGLVVLDVNMPRMDGMTFLRTLRQADLPLGATPVLVTSTEAAPRDAELGRAAGANFYLVKPVMPAVLIAYAALLHVDSVKSSERHSVLPKAPPA